MQYALVVYYEEIALKGRNRSFFENRLKTNIERKIKERELEGKVRRVSGRFLITLPKDVTKISDEWFELLSTTFGIVNFTVARFVESEYEQIAKQAVAVASENNFENFRITTRRSDKAFPMTSEELSREVGAEVVKALSKKVKLTKPDLEIKIEVFHQGTLVYAKRNDGPGGLPVGVSGKAVALLSGGLDSPVAAWYMMKRGMEISYIHFHNYPYTKRESVDKVEALAKRLSEWYGPSKLYLCPFSETQQEIVSATPEKFRIIMYRRFMLRVAEQIARRERAQALVTGEAIGQVASQTIENMRTIHSVTELPILQPLVGFDKREIIAKAEQIGTYETSILPHDDCCVFFMPREVKTKSAEDEVAELEKALDIDRLVREAVSRCEKLTI